MPVGRTTAPIVSKNAKSKMFSIPNMRNYMSTPPVNTASKGHRDTFNGLDQKLKIATGKSKGKRAERKRIKQQMIAEVKATEALKSESVNAARKNVLGIGELNNIIGSHVGENTFERLRRRYINNNAANTKSNEQSLHQGKILSSIFPILRYQKGSYNASKLFGDGNTTAHGFAIVSRSGHSATYHDQKTPWHRALIFDKNVSDLDVNVANNKGQTPLHIASGAPVKDLPHPLRELPPNPGLSGVKPLLKLGANPFTEDAAGKSSYQYMAQTNARAAAEQARRVQLQH